MVDFWMLQIKDWKIQPKSITQVVPDMLNSVKPVVQEAKKFQQKVVAEKKQEATDQDLANKSGYSVKEIKFLREVKKQGIGMQEAEWFIQQKRQEVLQPQESTIKNIGEWVVSFAGGIPKVIAETGILNKPIEALSNSVVGDVIRSWATKLFWAEDIKKYQQENAWKSFSQMAAWSQVWGNPESKAARYTENTLWALEMATAIPWLLKGWAKVAGMKALDKAIETGKVTEKAINKWWAGKILNLIKEWENKSNKIAALGRWGIDSQSAISKRWSWSKNVVKPSQKTLDAVATVKKEIVWASSDPQKLYTQLSNKIWDLSEWLAEQLKTVKIKSQTGKLKALKESLDNLIEETADYSKPTANAIKKAKESILKAKTAKEARDAAKQLDNLIPNSIKEWAAKWGKDALVYGKWRWARSAFNDFIDEAAEWVSEPSVKDMFKKISNLYRAKWWIEDNIVQITKPVIGIKQKLWTLAKNTALVWWAGYAAKNIFWVGEWWVPYQE
jgi:hypothetical protein